MSVVSPEQPLLIVPDSPLALRLLPVPVSEPPYDDELPSGARTARGTRLGPLRTLSALRLVPPPPDEPEGRGRTPLAALPAARPVAPAVVQGLLEVLAGVRPLKQLRSTTSLELYDQLERLVQARPRATGQRPGGGAVRSLHVQERPEGVAEVCATIHRSGRTAALALRLEGVDGRWSCTDVVGL